MLSDIMHEKHGKFLW
jgi:hypothetical protein